jgi:ribosomal protein S18 acetylase RimI-like enzyme
VTIKDKTGKPVGNAQFWKKNDDELYLNWITIKKDSRGQGYASAALKTAEQFGKKQGFKKMTLEVPGNAPDARHIYERMGFKVVKEELDPSDPVWGGLTSMEYNFDKK